VGINTAIVGDTYQGVSFSIPSNVAKQVYQRLRESGRVERGWLGVALTEVAEDQVVGDDPRVRGAMVSGLTNRGSPAAIAGLEMGDLILSVDHTAVRDMGHLMRLIGDSTAGAAVTLKILRAQVEMEIRVTLGSRPDALNVQ
jgi:S1-C subfamily serine protease